MSLLLSHASHYARPAADGPVRVRVRLRPRAWFGVVPEQWQVLASPPPQATTRAVDGFGTVVETLHWHRPLTALRLQAQGTLHGTPVSVTGAPVTECPPPPDLTPDIDPAFSVEDETHLTRETAPCDPDIAAYAHAVCRGSAAPGASTGAPVLADPLTEDPVATDPVTDARTLAHALARDLTYDPRATSPTTPAATAFRQRAGVCQDFTHVLVAALGALGHDARYVGGYRLAQMPATGTPIVRAELHAWGAVRGRDGLWHAVDPTYGDVPSPLCLPVAWGRCFADVAPIELTGTGWTLTRADAHASVGAAPRGHRRAAPGRPTTGNRAVSGADAPPVTIPPPVLATAAARNGPAHLRSEA